MSRYETSSLLRARLLNYFEGQTGDLGKSRALLQQTLLRLHGTPAGYATDSDVMPRALEIARDLMVAAHRRTPGELMSGTGEESACCRRFKPRPSPCRRGMVRAPMRAP
jgi:hypothetical protein